MLIPFICGQQKVPCRNDWLVSIQLFLGWQLKFLLTSPLRNWVRVFSVSWLQLTKWLSLWSTWQHEGRWQVAAQLLWPHRHTWCTLAHRWLNGKNELSVEDASGTSGCALSIQEARLNPEKLRSDRPSLPKQPPFQKGICILLHPWLYYFRILFWRWRQLSWI
jgi:hypothetical protein